ncbi:helix-turn-helix domain-containing protein [Acetobacter aceti]|uniref:helix-turn-helix domain-containing protein n=1 Tax=Acetobacter aceti TaxID=435 RepID=UPI0009D9B8C1
MNQNTPVSFALRLNDACKFAAVSRATMYRLIKSQKIEAVKVGSSTLILRESLVNWLQNLPRLNAS